MKRRFFLLATLLVSSVMICFAVILDLTGKWTGTLKTPNGNSFPLTYVFKVDGDKLTGALQGAQGEIPISEGKVSGSDFSFKLDFNGTPISNTGKYYVDSIAVDSEISGGKFHTVLLRAAN